ncbi:hypothetical protein ACIOWI_28760 [Streptomyces sp. NPDC087659]|uniref:hypothetical protein n=1 Tax=unclassified Streptomyces TaxID=2593676 RepID=UPI0036AD5020
MPRCSSQTRDRVLALVLAAVAVAVFAWGAGLLHWPFSPDRPGGRLGELAGRAGCRATLEAEEPGHRLASCADGDARYVLVTFTSARDQSEWIADTLPEGASYLAGTRWVAYGHPATVRTLKDRLGGEVLIVRR